MPDIKPDPVTVLGDAMMKLAARWDKKAAATHWLADLYVTFASDLREAISSAALPGKDEGNADD